MRIGEGVGTVTKINISKPSMASSMITTTKEVNNVTTIEEGIKEGKGVPTSFKEKTDELEVIISSYREKSCPSNSSNAWQ
jgi:hypothetical protein